MRKPIIGVMGPGDSAGEDAISVAEALGHAIASAGWITLSGGRNTGVMDAVNRGANLAGGLTIGILPTADHSSLSPFVDVPIVTDMGSARNNINVLSSDVVIACGMAAGTASEVSLALKAKRPVVLLGCSPAARAFFSEIGGRLVSHAESVDEAVAMTRALLRREGEPHHA